MTKFETKEYRVNCGSCNYGVFSTKSEALECMKEVFRREKSLTDLELVEITTVIEDYNWEDFE